MDEQNERFNGPFSEKIVWPCKGGVDRQIKNEGGGEWTNKMKGLRDRSARWSSGPAREESIDGVRTKEGRNGRIK